MQILKNKTMATLISIVLIIGMSIPLLAIPPAKAEVINGINYDANTAAAMKAGMNWAGQANNASATRILVWTRYQDKVPTRTYNVIAPNPVGKGQLFTVVYFLPIVPLVGILSVVPSGFVIVW